MSLLPILLLAAAGFTVLTTEFLIVGLLPAMARDLHITISQAGLLVTLFALTVASAGPVLTALLANTARKKLFIAILILFGVSNTLAALAPNLAVMVVARVMPALALPVFWSLAGDTAIDIMGRARAGKALSMITFGVVAALVFGIPIGTLIAAQIGWRHTFLILAGVAFSKAFLLYCYFPSTTYVKPHVSLMSQIRIMRRPLVVGHVLLSVLVFTGMFTAYTYLADMLERLAGFNGNVVGWCLMGFGAVGMIGNWLGGRFVDRNPLGATLLFSTLLALGMGLMVPALGAHWSLALTLSVWGLAQAALFLVCQARVMGIAPEAAAFAGALNISGSNLGVGGGAFVGGYVIDHYGVDQVGFAAAALMLAAMTLALVLMCVSRSKPGARIDRDTELAAVQTP